MSSLSQEEIEALLSGEIGDENESTTKDTEDTEDTKDTKDTEDIDLNQLLDGLEIKPENTPTIEEEMEAIEALNNDSIENSEAINKSSTEKNEDLLQSEVPELETETDDCVFPLPSTKEHKVVSQLSEVAKDSEEKASKIFDYLSLVTEEDDKIDTQLNKQLKDFEEFEELFIKLSQKFPKIEIFNQKLETIHSLKKEHNDMKEILTNLNNSIFEAMEMMQYHDINRQKIERVMSVIKKLSYYLNGLFESEDMHEVKIAKHIHGDSHNTVNEDDINKLLEEMHISKK